MIRLRELREERGLTLTEFSKILNVDKAALSRIEHGFRDPKSDFLQACSSYLNVSVDEILGLTKGSKSSNKPSNLLQHTYIPLYYDTNVNHCLDPKKVSTETLVIPSSSSHDHSLFALKITNSSMEPQVYSGDIAIIQRQDRVKSGHFAALSIMNKEIILRIIHLSSTGMTIQAYRNNSTVQFFSNKEIEELPIKIIGRVLELRHRYD